MRKLLIFGVGYFKRDNLVGCESCSRPRKEGKLDFGNLVSKIISLVVNWLWPFAFI